MLADLFNDPKFMPHGFCIAWKPALLWTLVMSNAVIGLSYYSIPVALLSFVRRQPTLRFNAIFVMFGIFIFACGTTHFISVLNIWQPAYGLDAFVLVLTAAVSVVTAIVLWPLVPRACAFLDRNEADRRELVDVNRRLTESEQRFRAVFDSMLQFSAVLDPKGVLLETNSAVVKLGGVPESELIGKSFWDCHWWQIDPENQALIRDSVARAALGEIVRFDVQAQTARGDVTIIDFSLRPVRDAVGRVVMLVSEGRPVEGERRVQAALAESESRFRLAMKNAPIGEAIVGLDGRWLAVNQALCSMLGYTEAELLAKTFHDINHPDDLASDLEKVRALVENEHDSYRLEKRYLRADGQIVEAQLDVSLVRGADGTPLNLLAQIQDVTGRRQLEREQQLLTQRLSLALRISGMGVADWDLKTGAILMDDALLRIYGIPANALVHYSAWRDMVDPVDLPRVEVSLQATISTKAPQTLEFRIRHPKLGTRYIEAAVGVVLDGNNDATRVIGVNLDITERWEAEQRVSNSRTLLRNLIDNLPVWVSMFDPAGRFVVINRRNAKTFGVPIGSIEGKHFREALPGPFLKRRGPSIERALAGEAVELTDRIIEDGRVVDVQGLYLPITDGPQTGSVVAVFSDVTAIKQSEARIASANRELEKHMTEVLKLQEQLKDAAIRDGLTGLYNRRHFDEVLAQELNRAAREQYGVSLLLADLDHFKRLNDLYGHQTGDEVLRVWSDLARGKTRSSDILCRYGGEEFVMVLPHFTLEQAIERAETLRVMLSEKIFTAAQTGETFTCTVSIGVAYAAPGSETPDSLLRKADNAMYRAKSAGRNQVIG